MFVIQNPVFGDSTVSIRTGNKRSDLEAPFLERKYTSAEKLR